MEVPPWNGHVARTADRVYALFVSATVQTSVENNDKYTINNRK